MAHRSTFSPGANGGRPRASRQSSRIARRIRVAAPIVALCLVAGCGGSEQSGGNAGDAIRRPTDHGNGAAAAIVDNGIAMQGSGMGSAGPATPQQQEWLARATAFVSRPEQQRDLQTALRARASTHPHYCPAATFAPKRVDIAFDPAPQFAPDGTMTRGTVVYRATMQGCSEPVLLTVYVDAVPGLPLRFRAGLAGTTFADPDLQERAIPYAVGAARPLLPGCAQVSPIDTRRLGERPDATGSLLPWSEFWLVSGCGRLVSTKLDFTPDRARNLMLVHADASATRMLQTGANVAASTGGRIGGSAGPPAAPTTARTVAAATGTSLIPLGGADIPGAKIAGTCLSRLRTMSPATMPDHVECLQGLPPRLGATTVCSAARGQAAGQMTATVTGTDPAANSVQFQCEVRAR